MKEIMVPYMLLIWLLVKAGVIPWNLKTQFWSTAFGIFLAFMLFTGSRFWAPVDLTNSTTVRAPRSVLSPLLYQQVDQIFVTHNQKVATGDLIYTLRDDQTATDIDAIRARIVATRKEIKADEAEMNNRIVELDRLKKLGTYASEQARDQLRASIQANRAGIQARKANITDLEAQIKAARYLDEQKDVRAPFDGQVSVVNIANGTRVGNMHLFDTSRKFLEMRLPDQAFGHIEPGMFAEFFVTAYPGHVFRARVHSVRAGTGEADLRLRQGEESVRGFVGQNRSNHGRTVILDIVEPEGYEIPIGATGSAWISARKPSKWLGFIDIIGGATVRLSSIKAYFTGI